MNKALLLTLLLLAGAAQAEIYTWVDAQGVRHYSDNAASGGAKRADLPGIQSVDGNKDALAELQAVAGMGSNPGAQDMPEARTPQLSQPEAGATFRDAQGIVPVALTIGGSSELRSGEQVTYYLDGSPIPQSPTDQTQLQLGNVPRGSHTLSAALIYQGREIRRTEPVTFYMQPPSAISPLNTGQAGSDGDAGSGIPGTSVAPPAGNSAGVPAAPRINSSSAPAGLNAS
ncbi:DUF4124 domain-containing protein [Salinisphaera aquimarina]|uniref:DUF4124 domain-containing protein n=1 Tax=Salinisphaera aquimarina TaxID=2094031 RepID=A0ABV7EM85_9GAMM